MKLTKKTIKLICELEKIIGNECYNPSSVNGYTGEEGCSFRYPVWYTNKEQEDRKCYGLIQDVDKDYVSGIKYKFGANQLYIGNAIIKVLERLEEKYDVDFNE